MRAIEVVRRFADRSRSASVPIAAIVFVSMIRNLGEHLVGRPVAGQDVDVVPAIMIVGLTAGLAFYSMNFWLFSILLSRLTGRRMDQVSGAVSIGLLAGLLPPVLDAIASPGQRVIYGYFTAFLPFFFGEGVPIGESITLWLVVVATGIAVLVIAGSLSRAVLAIIGAWAILEFMGCWGMIAKIWYPPDAGIQSLRVAYFGFALLVWIAVRSRHLAPSLRRVNHALPLGCLTLAGSLWSGDSWQNAVALAAMMTVTMLLVVAQNDWYDRDQDAIQGRSVSMTADDSAWLWFMGATGLLTVMLWSHMAAWLLAAYAAAAALYHLPGLRLKRIVCVAYAIEGFCGSIAFTLGCLGAPGAATSRASGSILWPAILAFGGQALVSGLKDWKDIESDGASGVVTHYTLAVRKGMDPRTVHSLLVAASLLALLVPPVLVLAFHGWHVVVPVLAVLAIVPMAWVFFVKERRRAVEGMLWLLSAYLLVLAMAMHVAAPPGRGPAVAEGVGSPAGTIQVDCTCSCPEK